MSTTWARSTHIRHPWFDTVMMKRKHRDTVSPEEELAPSPASSARATMSPKPSSPPPAKRRRCSLENGFAHLSLNTTPHVTSPPPPTTFEPPGVSGSSSPPHYYVKSASSASSSSSSSPDLYPHIQDVTGECGMEAEPYSMGSSTMQHPTAYTVVEPQIPEVDMKTSSWYEPERDRIVVTDIDSFAQSDDEGENNPSDNVHQINPALLSHIRATTTRPPPSLLPGNSSNSQALVLFKPLPIVGDELERIHAEHARLAREAELAAAQQAKLDEDDDAMDVEP